MQGCLISGRLTGLADLGWLTGLADLGLTGILSRAGRGIARTSESLNHADATYAELLAEGG